MKFLIVLLLAVFPFGQLARFNVPDTEIVLHLNDFVVFLVMSFWLLRNRKLSGPMIKPLLLFLGAVVVSLIFNLTNYTIKELFSAALYPLRFFAYAGLYFVFSGASQTEKATTKRWLHIAVAIMVAFGLAQYIFVPNVAFLSAFDWDDHYFRLVGSFLDPGFTGGILVLGLVFVFLQRPNSRSISWVSNLVFWIPLSAIYVALTLTYSRASYLMYIISFAAISFYRKSLKIVLIAAVVLAVTLPILPKTFGEGTKLGRENSVTARIKNWGISLNVWQKSPIFGIGFNTYRYAIGVESQSHSGGADSSILLVLATTGILGLLAYLNVLKAMWQLGSGNLLFKASFLGIIIHSFFNNTLFYPWVMEWLWIILAVV